MVVFKILNKVTGKNYVGSCRGDIFERWELYARAADAGLDFPLYRDIREHGENQFSITELDFAEDREELKEIELFHTIELSARSLRSYKFGLKDSVVKRCTKTQLDKAWQKEMSEQARAEAEKAAEIRSLVSSSSLDEEPTLSSSLSNVSETTASETIASESIAPEAKGVSTEVAEKKVVENKSAELKVENRASIDSCASTDDVAATAKPVTSSATVSASILAKAVQKRDQGFEKAKVSVKPELDSFGVSAPVSRSIPENRHKLASTQVNGSVKNSEQSGNRAKPADKRVVTRSAGMTSVARQLPAAINQSNADNQTIAGNQTGADNQLDSHNDQAAIDNDQREREKSVLADGISLLVRTLGSAEKLSGLQQQTQRHVDSISEALTESARTLSQLQIRQQHAALKAQEAAQAVEASLAANEALTAAHQKALDCSDSVLTVLKDSSSAGDDLTQLQNELTRLLGRLKDDSRSSAVSPAADRRNVDEKKRDVKKFAGFGNKTVAQRSPGVETIKSAAAVSATISKGVNSTISKDVCASKSNFKAPGYSKTTCSKTVENTEITVSTQSDQRDSGAREYIENAELSSREKIIEIESSKLVNRLKQLDTLIQKTEPDGFNAMADNKVGAVESYVLTADSKIATGDRISAVDSASAKVDIANVYTSAAQNKVEAGVSSTDQEVVSAPPARAWIAPQDKSQPEACLVKKEVGDATVIRRRSKRMKLASQKSHSGTDSQEKGYQSISAMNIHPSKTQRQIPSRKKLSIRGR